MSLTMLRQHYYVLGLDPSSASQEDVKTRYKQLARETHPDRNLGSEESAKVNFQTISHAYEKLMNHFTLQSKPLPPMPVSASRNSLEPSATPLPTSPIVEDMTGTLSRSTSRRRPMNLEATWQANTPATKSAQHSSPLLTSPMPPPVPLKLRSKSVRSGSAQSQSPTSRPLRSPRYSTARSRNQPAPPKSPTQPRKARNFSVPHREHVRSPLSPTFTGIHKAHTIRVGERTNHDIKSSIFSIVTRLQTIASTTYVPSRKPSFSKAQPPTTITDDAMYATLQRLKRRMLNGRHRKNVHSAAAAIQHWTSLEKSLLLLEKRCLGVRAKELSKTKRRNEIVGQLNVWEQNLRTSWTNDF